MMVLSHPMLEHGPPEAAGAAEYRKLPGIDQRQQTSAKIMQRSNLIIMPMVFARYNKY